METLTAVENRLRGSFRRTRPTAARLKKRAPRLPAVTRPLRSTDTLTRHAQSSCHPERIPMPSRPHNSDGSRRTKPVFPSPPLAAFPATLTPSPPTGLLSVCTPRSTACSHVRTHACPVHGKLQPPVCSVDHLTRGLLPPRDPPPLCTRHSSPQAVTRTCGRTGERKIHQPPAAKLVSLTGALTRGC